MTALWIAFFSAAAYGISDFVGGLRSRSSHFVWVTLVSQIVLTVGVIVWGLGFRPGTPTPEAVGWGVLGAFGHVLGGLMLMRGLAAGAMHVAGPLSAVVGAALPVVVGVLGGERPSVIAWLGVALALPAVWLVAAGGASDEPDVAAGPGIASASGLGRGLPEGGRDGVLAGLGFALFYVALARPGESAGGWPLISLEVTALVLLCLVALKVRPPGRLRDAANAWPMGALALAGTILYFVATHAGMLSLVVIVTSLYPAFTVMLAIGVLHERPSTRQVAGLALAAASVVLIAGAGA